MLKKLITGAIAATITVTSVMSGALCGSSTFSKSNAPTIDQSTVAYDLMVTNSLGKYLKKMSNENNVDANLEKLSDNTSSTFEMNCLDFDIETGVLTAFSTQSEKCYVLFSVIDEDTNDVVQKYRCEVEAGNCIVTKKKINTGELPKYFMLEAKPVDKNDKDICDAFHVDTYTKIMQEIADTDIHDFDEERVVSFDENEDTNFIVLSDEPTRTLYERSNSAINS